MSNIKTTVQSLWRNTSETAEQQLHAAPLAKTLTAATGRAQASQKHKPEKCFPRPLESIKHFFWPPRCEAGSETSIPQRRMPWRRLCEASESLEQQQDSCPRHAKHKPEKRQAKNGAFATLPHGAETAGNGSEKATRHYKPSSGKPKTMRSQPFHTVPKLQLRSRKNKTQVKDRSR